MTISEFLQRVYEAHTMGKPMLTRETSKKRANWQRNHVCFCGSGKKFKKCCMFRVAKES